MWLGCWGVLCPKLLPPHQCPAESSTHKFSGNGSQMAGFVWSLQVDALCPRRDASRQLESRVVAQLLTLMDGGAALPSAHSQGVCSLFCFWVGWGG